MLLLLLLLLLSLWNYLVLLPLLKPTLQQHPTTTP
jgi:hypothetical protein